MDARGVRRLEMEERKALLQQVLEHEVSLGARVEGLVDVMAVVTVGQRRVTLSIDEYGQVLVDGQPAQPSPRSPPAQALPRGPLDTAALAGPEARKALLERVLRHEVSLGARIESQTDFSAVVISGPRRVTLAIDERGQVLVDGQPARPGPPSPPAQTSAPAPRPSAVETSAGGSTGLVSRHPLVAALVGVVLLACVAAVAGSVLNPRAGAVARPVQGQAIHDIDAVSFLPVSAGLLGRTQIHKAPRGNAAWAKYSAPAQPGVEVEVQARWEGPEFDEQLSAGGTPADMAGRRVYVSGPNVYDQYKIRWADRGWHYYVRVSYPDEVARTEAEGVAQSVAADIITRGSQLTSAAR